MNIQTPDPPESSVRSAQEGIQELMTADQGPTADRVGLLAQEPLDSVRLTAPHKIYVLSLQDLLEGNVDVISHARYVGWRFLVGSDRQGIVGAAETTGTDEYGEHSFAALSQDSSPDFTRDLIESVERDRDAEESELRLLRIPAAYSTNLWFHGGSQELMIPLPPVPGVLSPGAFYDASELFDALRRVVEEQRPSGATSN